MVQKNGGRDYVGTATVDGRLLSSTDEGILSAIANTPLVKLTRILPDAKFDLYAKLEFLNPGGSTKDRPALNIIRHGIDTGMIRKGTVIV